MRERRKLNVAIIGYGFMGRAHSNAFHQVGRYFDVAYDLKLKVACGRNETRLREMADSWGWEQVHSDWTEVVNRPDIDVVDICTPNYLHEPIAIAAARAGKIVLCEKPLANSVEEAGRMTEAAKHVPTLVWFNYRRVPAVSLARQLVQEGRVGKVFHYRGLYLQSWGAAADPAAWRFKPQEAGSGVMGDLLSHSLDLATWINGPIRRLCSQIQTFVEGREVDDAVALLAEFDNGSLGTFEATRFASGNLNRNSLEINGARGALEFNLENLNHLQFTDLDENKATQGRRNLMVTEDTHPYVSHFWPSGHIIGYEHTFIATLADFLTALHKKERFRPDFADALEVQKLLDAVVRSSTQQGWVSMAGEYAGHR
jgi:predicted dehydrogenase